MATHSLTQADDGLAPLLTINDVARFLGISRATVYELIRARELAPVRVGERMRFELSTVQAYLDRHRETQSQ